MEPTYLSVFLTCIFLPLLYLAYLSMKKPKNFPPGPLGFPFLGSMHYVTQYPHLGMKAMARKYGNVFSVKYFHRNVICVNGYEEMKEIFGRKAKTMVDRPSSLTSFYKGKKVVGIFEALYGPSWSANRRVYAQCIRELGIIKIENLIQTEASYMIKELQKASGQAIDPHPLISVAVLNVIASILFGSRYDNEDDKIKRLCKLNEKAFELFSLSDWRVHLASSYPEITKIWIPQPAKEFLRVYGELIAFCTEEIDELIKQSDPICPKNYVDYYFVEMKAKTDKDENDKTHSLQEMKFSIQDIFQAGSETMTISLRWIMLYLAGHQEIQQKIHEEIDSTIGSTKLPEHADRLKMPYSEAAIYEVMRYAVVAPTALFRVAIEDTSILGYNVPKGTIIWPNQYSSNFQADKWKNPMNFDPENFLDENGKFFQPDAFFLFGGGPRMCLGMSLAKQEIFLLTVSTLQKFLIKPENEGAKIDYEPVPGLAMSPKPFKVRLIEKTRTSNLGTLQKFLSKPEKEGAKIDYVPVPGLALSPKPFEVRPIEKN